MKINVKNDKSAHEWNDYYETLEIYDPSDAMADSTLEAGLDWISENQGMILDIGCGNGQMLLRCLYKGAVKTIGLDSSYQGISLARRSASEHFSTLQTKWIWGNLQSLSQLPDACVKGIILSDVLGYISTDETKYVFSQMERLMDQGGRLLLIRSEIPSDRGMDQEALNALLKLDYELNFEDFLDNKNLKLYRYSFKK